MSAVSALGRLENVPLRKAWPNEAQNFTPWLAEDANLSFLGEAIGLQLELEETERNVGPFAADILAKEVGTERWVLIENQIAPTDHSHLGQLLTYAAGLDARVIVWIAETFREQHRAAIDFLNRAINEEYSFFAVQVELFRIGDSALAPSFTVVAKPNNWSKQGQVVRRLAEETLSSSQNTSREFWAELIGKASSVFPPLAGRTPYKTSWQAGERLLSGSRLYVDCNASFTATGRLRVEIYLGHPLAKRCFNLLFENRSAIQSTFGHDLTWEELPKGQDARIAFYMPGEQRRENRSAWPEQQRWLLTWWPKLAATFRPQLTKIDVAQLALADAEGVE